MGHNDGSVKVVLTAVVVNACVTIAKSIGWLFSFSPSMLAETIHSFADTANQVLILVGIRISKKGPTREFPTGYGQARYLWNLISASGIFFIGFGVTTYHGVAALISPHHDSQISYNLGIGILLFAAIVEGYAFLVALKEVNVHRGSMPFIKFIRISKDPTSIGVLLEDAIAVFGVILALIGMALSAFFHSHIPDAVASIMIGILLGMLAFIMVFMNGRLLINRSVSMTDEKEIKDFIQSQAIVKNITALRTEILSPDQIELSIEIDFNSSALKQHIFEAGETEKELVNKVVQQTIKYTGLEINNLEKQIQNRFPEIKFIDLEIN